MKRALVATTLALSVACLAAETRAQPAPIELQSEPPAPSPPPPRRQYASLGLGLAAGLVQSRGFDVFGVDDALFMSSLGGTVTAWPTRPLSVHLAFGWDWGRKSASARGAESQLDLNRLSLGLEARYVPAPPIALVVRAIPSLLHASGTIEDASFGGRLEASAWTWGVDLTGGAAARIAAFGDRDHPAAAIWTGLDLGYRLAGPAEMRLRPGGLTDEDRGRRFGDLPMADLDLSGLIGRLNVSVSF